MLEQVAINREKHFRDTPTGISGVEAMYEASCPESAQDRAQDCADMEAVCHSVPSERQLEAIGDLIRY